MAAFVTFEGVEGSGKSAQARALYRRLLKLGVPALLTHEPGGTRAGERITRLLKWSGGAEISPLTELLLFNASRSQLVGQTIRPALKRGETVICDRYTDSTVAYQSSGRGLDRETVERINATATGELKPDLTILLDITAETGFARISGRKRDRFEEEGIAFHDKVRACYLKLAREEPERWLVVDGGKPKKEIAEIIWQRVSRLTGTAIA